MKKYIFCFLTLCFTSMVVAQNLNQAKNLFDKGEFEKAKTALSKLIKRSPNHAETNYYYGASLYETGELEKSLPYLEKSAKRNYIGAFRYLGKAYADMFRFEEAIENYETHIEWLEEKNRKTEQAETELTELRTKARILKNVEMVTVIDSFVVSKQELLDSYKISLSSGKIQMNESKTGTIYENEMGTKRIISEKNDSLMQLYTQTKLLDGWGKKEAIKSLNNNSNMNFPFIMGDGITLYFASDGEGSLGGYDIFVTRYDSEDNTYLRPSNIGAPFNSTANDYLFAVDEFNHLGWFVTDRNQSEGYVCVYVFIPNEIKKTYNYETCTPDFIKDVATLKKISTTWTDMELVRNAQKRLSSIIEQKSELAEQKNEFLFVVNDNNTYTNWDDFRSKEAQNLYRQLLQKEKDLHHLQADLEQKREQFANENELGKKRITPSILDLEKRIPQIQKEVEKLTIEVRRFEIEKLK